LDGTDPDGVVETTTHILRCASCHNSNVEDAGTKAYGPNPSAQLSFENNPFGLVRKDVGFGNALPFAIYTSEPTKKSMINPTAFGTKKQTLAQICTDISNNLANFNQDGIPKPSITLALCNKLASYQAGNVVALNGGCGTGMTGGKVRVCRGVSGGGTYKNDQNEISSLAVDYSGQATKDGTNINFVDWDGALSAVNYTKHASILSLVLSDLGGTVSVLTANGTAQYSKDGSAPVPKKVQVTLDIDNNAIKITDTDNAGAVLLDAKTGLVNAALRLSQ
jgi:hypothetical protein